jgi:hypothetical protein
LALPDSSGHGEKLIMLFFFHKLLMFLATLCLLTGISTATFFRHKPNWLKIHKLFNSAGFVYTSGGEHLDGIHQIVGLFAFVLTGISLFLGFYQFQARTNLQTIKTFHRWLGRFSLLLIIAALILGLRQAGII